MGMLFGPREGSWWVNSNSDSRWNGRGTGFVGGFGIPADAQRFIDQKKQELKEEPPDDLEYGYMKD
jgi:hypothetical protein